MPAWTRPPDVVRRLRKRWDGGEFASAWAAGAPFEPVSVPLRGPTGREMSGDLDAAREWLREWEAATRGGVRLEYRTVGGRSIGVNTVPARVWVDTDEVLFRLLRVGQDVARLGSVLEASRTTAPRLLDWAVANPLKALASEHVWQRLLATVVWVDERAQPGMYVRQIDVPGVDTKFIEHHRAILTDLLDRQLPEHRIDHGPQRADFVGRYRFRRKPAYVRVRPLGRGVEYVPGVTEVGLRVEELAASPAAASTVFVVENEITFLAFPAADDAVVLLGGGYALSRLAPLAWLADRDLVYWGDLDTHGFAILDRLRQVFPHARSMLMDRMTLLAHEVQWVREPSPTRVRLDRLTPSEADLYRDLVEDTFGPSVRLEQERISYSAIESAMPVTPAR